ncbi:hypothetical protein [Stenomitos frigidus]|nr:hypothetical protein [Stenomitos frigidus]
MMGCVLSPILRAIGDRVIKESDRTQIKMGDFEGRNSGLTPGSLN